jgi:hypothetical protein
MMSASSTQKTAVPYQRGRGLRKICANTGGVAEQVLNAIKTTTRGVVDNPRSLRNQPRSNEFEVLVKANVADVYGKREIKLSVILDPDAIQRKYCVFLEDVPDGGMQGQWSLRHIREENGTFVLPIGSGLDDRQIEEAATEIVLGWVIKGLEWQQDGFIIDFPFQSVRDGRKPPRPPGWGE